MLFNEPSPLETKVLTRRFGLPNSASIDTYLATEGYQAFLKAAKMKPEEMLAFYSAQLPTVEINNTFYRMPKAEMLADWAATTPAAPQEKVKPPAKPARRNKERG